MEIIRKKISMENSKSHVQGVLPFIPFNIPFQANEEPFDGTNYGNFAVDIKEGDLFDEISEVSTSCITEDYEGQRIRTCEIMKRYSYNLDVLRKGVHLKHVKQECGGNVKCDEKVEPSNNYKNKFITDFKYSGTTYDFLREAVAYHSSEFIQKTTYFQYSGDDSDIEDYVILYDNDLFDLYGGQSLIELVDKYLISGSTDEPLSYISGIPYVSTSILLTNSLDDTGILTPYFDVEDYDEYYDCETGPKYSDVNNYNGQKIEPKLQTNIKTIKTESKLQTLRIPIYYYSDNNILLDGLYVNFENEENGKLFEAVYYTGTSLESGVTIITKYYTNPERTDFDHEEESVISVEISPIPQGAICSVEGIYTEAEPYVISSGSSQKYEYPIGDGTEGDFYTKTFSSITFCDDYRWWEIYDYEGDKDEIQCADDEDVTPCNPNESCTDKKYRTVTIFKNIENMSVAEDLSNGDTYYYLVKYNNSSCCPMEIPYKENLVFNREYDELTDSYYGDFIMSITSSSTKLIFDYIIGAQFTDSSYTEPILGTGIFYNGETYDYKKSDVGVTIDGNEKCRIYLYEIDYEGKKQDTEDIDLNLSRKYLPSQINQYITGDVWRCDDESVYDTYLIKEDYLMGISSDVQTDINVTIDRGNAAAFERHFKLSECNSLEDIEIYRNGSQYIIE